MRAIESTYSHTLIYVMSINDADHEGLLKVGYCKHNSNTPPEELEPSCTELNEAARRRIKQYTKTAITRYELLHTELALRMRGGMPQYFIDKAVHYVLKNSGVEIIKHEDTHDDSDWCRTDLQTVLAAIKAVKENKVELPPEEISTNNTPIVLRPEQNDAVKRTCKRFERHKNMLWNAKMRFGKTLCALFVVKKMQYKHTLILTHRPVVLDGWFKDFDKVFVRGEGYHKGSHVAGQGWKLEHLQQSCERYIYFASLQDLRGSAHVGGQFDKNNAVFNTDWDCVIIDEAHEGTLTPLGEAVVNAVVKENTRVLRLSGTPFNLLSRFSEDEIFTWDYVMEQQAKSDWYANHLDGKNPYEELPRLNILTYKLADEFCGKYEDFEDKAFNFRDFFRVWTGDEEIDGKPVPADSAVGRFVHEDDVRHFLDLLTKESPNSNYPFSTQHFRDNFRHTFWVLPGIAAVRALKDLMEHHAVFGCGAFTIVNIAGNGDEDNEDRNALKNVRDAIGKHPESNYTITLSCGKLTAGVTVSEWTAVFMLAGAYTTSASNYLQTIFRVQSPCSIHGMQKTECYAFDFAPDRTLRMVAEAGKLNAAKKRRTPDNARQHMAAFLNFCPVISVEGSTMKPYDVSAMLQQLKKAHVESVVRSGFDDRHLYSDALLHLNDVQLKDIDDLGTILGRTKQSTRIEKIDINVQGLTQGQWKKGEEAEKKKAQKKPLTAKEKELLEKMKAARKNREKAISILRGISIRIPLLIFGADIDYKTNITVDTLPDIVDDESWEEFMPYGVTKRIYRKVKKYYDPEIFIAAGRRIRSLARRADDLPPTERVKHIALIFSYFRNPDKETVLTPWRVVNMQLADCLGGFDFYDAEHMHELENPRLVLHPDITPKCFFNPQARILELNAKTGLYSLYATYCLTRARCHASRHINARVERDMWDAALAENIFIICKTKMACSIAKRTLVGYRDVDINIRYLRQLIETLKTNTYRVACTIRRPHFFKNNNITERMKFNAIIGNPPYQEMDGGNKASAVPVYHHFVRVAKQLSPDFVSLIMPAKWYNGGRGLDDFRAEMLKDKRMRKLVDFEDSQDCFTGVDIAGGVCYFLWDAQHEGLCQVMTRRGVTGVETSRDLSASNSFVRSMEAMEVIAKVHAKNPKGKFLDSRVSSQKPFGLRTYARPAEDGDLQLRFNGGTGPIPAKMVTAGKGMIQKWKVITSYLTYDHAGRANNQGQRRILSTTEVLPPGTVCTETYLVLDFFDKQSHAKNFYNFMRTKFVRYLIAQAASTQHLSKASFAHVPILDYSEAWDDEKLNKHFQLTQEEIEVINTCISEM